MIEPLRLWNFFKGEIPNYLSGLRPLESVALVGGLLLLWVLAVRFRNDRRLGSVSVDPLVGQSDSGTEALTARMRCALADVGFFPAPGVPAGSPDETLPAAVETSTVPGAPFAAAMVKLVLQLRRILNTSGYRVSGVLLTRAEGGGGTASEQAKPSTGGALAVAVNLSDGDATGGNDERLTNASRGVVVSLSEAASGRVLDMTTLWGGSHEEVVKEAAFWAYLRMGARRRGSRRDPPWARWTDLRALRKYQRGIAHDDANPPRLERARDDYRAAIERQPGNALVRLRMGALHERHATLDDNKRFRGGSSGFLVESIRPGEVRPEPWLKAVAEYRTITDSWSSQLEARYRLAVLYGSSDAWVFVKNQISSDRLGGVERDRLARLFARALAQEEPRTKAPSTTWADDAELTKAVEERASDQWRVLSTQLGGIRLVRRLIKPRNRLEPRGRALWEFRRIVSTVRLCVRVKKAGVQGDSGAVAKLERRLRLLLLCPYKDWRARYNAVCFYSLAAAGADPARHRTYVDKGLKRLEQVIDDPDMRLDCDRLRNGDPDLTELRKDPRFLDIARRQCSFATAAGRASTARTRRRHGRGS